MWGTQKPENLTTSQEYSTPNTQCLVPRGSAGETGHHTIELMGNALICGFVLQGNTWQITNKISCKDLEDPCPEELLYEGRVFIWFDENKPISLVGVYQLEPGPGFQQGFPLTVL